MSKPVEHEHRYARLNDRQIFCEGCGEIKTADPVYSPPVYVYPSALPCWCGLYHYGQPHPWYVPSVTWSNNSTTDTSSGWSLTVT
jgi:hypothetical protein